MMFAKKLLFFQNWGEKRGFLPSLHQGSHQKPHFFERLQIFLLFFVLAGVGCGSAEPVALKFDSAEIAQGKAIYQTHCARCHGINLEGGYDGTFPVPSHNVEGHTWHHPDSFLLDRIRNGKLIGDSAEYIPGSGGMPAYKELLTESEIQAVLNYIKNEWPPYIQATQAQKK